MIFAAMAMLGQSGIELTLQPVMAGTEQPFLVRWNTQRCQAAGKTGLITGRDFFSGSHQGRAQFDVGIIARSGAAVPVLLPGVRLRCAGSNLCSQPVMAYRCRGGSRPSPQVMQLNQALSLALARRAKLGV